MFNLSPQPKPPKPTLVRVGKSEYQFPAAATEVSICNSRGKTLWKARRSVHHGPISWQGVDFEGQLLSAGDYLCHLVYPDGQSVYIPFLFAA